jgi:hypothetical protein
VERPCREAQQIRDWVTGAEQELLLALVDDIKPLMAQNTVIVADAGYHSEDTSRGSRSARSRHGSPTRRCARVTSALPIRPTQGQGRSAA